MGRVNASKLRNKAAKLVEKRKYDKAVVVYHELESAEPQNPDWPRRAADCYRRLDENESAVQAFARAADKYAKAGFLVKAVAVCKMILAIDPAHTAALEHMAELQEQRGMSIKAPAKSAASKTSDAPEPAAASEPAATPKAAAAPAKPAPAARAAAPPRTARRPARPGRPKRADTASRSFGAVAGPASGTPPPSKRVKPPAPPRSAPPAPPAASSVGPEPPPAHFVSRQAQRMGLEEPPSTERTLQPGAALDSISLADVVPESREVQGVGGQPSGIFEIPIEEGDLVLEHLGTDLELDFAAAAGEDATAVLGIVLDGTDEAVDEASQVGEAARSVLPRTPLFSDLSPAALHHIIGSVDLVELAPGESVFKQGDAADAFYVVSEGAVAAIDEGPPRVQLGMIEEGQFFGEIGVVTDQPRGATIEAVQPTELLKIQRDAIGDLVETEPAALKVMLRFLRERLIDNLVRTSPLFEPFQGAERATLASRFKFLEVDVGGELVEQGQRAQGLYVLLTGRAEVARDNGGERERLATLGPGDIFGEMSLLSGEPAVASVRAVSKCFVLELPGDVFREVIMTHPQVLMFVGDLVDQRKRQNQSIASGDEDYAEGHLDFF